MILITGAAGFIGSNLLISLQEKGIGPVVICDRFHEGSKWRNLRKHHFHYHVFPEDLADFLELHGDKIKAVFHLGASSSTTEQDVDWILHNNLGLSIDLWEWCIEHEVRYIYASSAATYGNGTRGFEDDESLAYLKSLQPLNAYGWSKHLFDMRVMSDVEAGKKPPQWAGLKFFNVYGPNEYHKDTQQSVLANLFPYAKEGRPLKLFKSYRSEFNDGEQKRDFVYVKDCCDIMIWLYEHPEHSGLFNVGTGQSRTFNDVAHALFNSLDVKEPRIEYIDMPQAIRGKYQYFTESNNKKLSSIGYDKPMTSLEDGTKEYVQHYLMQDDPYR